MRLTVPGEIVENWYGAVHKWCHFTFSNHLQTVNHFKLLSSLKAHSCRLLTITSPWRLGTQKIAFSAAFDNYKGQESASTTTFCNCSPGWNAMLIEASTLYHNMWEKCKRKSGQVSLPVAFAKVEEILFQLHASGDPKWTRFSHRKSDDRFPNRPFYILRNCLRAAEVQCLLVNDQWKLVFYRPSTRHNHTNQSCTLFPQKVNQIIRNCN